jgi:RimJ/RimL family protein N-acetyltransferase
MKFIVHDSVAENEGSDILLQQANDVNVSDRILEYLSRSNDEKIRGAVALNVAAPKQLLVEMLNDSSMYVLNCLRQRGFERRPVLMKPARIVGNNLVLKNATVEDASFILELRIDLIKSKFISKTSNDLELQKLWLQKYSHDCEQVYFVILDKQDNKVGTVRIYEIKEDSFCWGSWILKNGVSSSYAIESALLVYSFALTLGFKKSHFEVKRENHSVWKFHERFGAQKVGESSDDYFYNISHESIINSIKKYKKYLPNNLIIEY